MDCKRCTDLLHAHRDGELDAVSLVDLENHLRECDACRARHAELSALGEALRREATRYSLPSELEATLRQSLESKLRPEQSASAPQSLATRTAGKPNGLLPWHWAGLGGAGGALAASLIWAASLLLGPGAGEDWMPQSVIDGHVRSLQVNHLTDVASSDQHTVKPWFNGRLDFAPPVRDLTHKGYPLLGGRLDYLKQRTVAAIAYRHRRHIINVFILPDENGTQSIMREYARQGYHLLNWRHAGLEYWTISDLNMAELQAFAKLLTPAADAGGSP